MLDSSKIMAKLISKMPKLNSKMQKLISMGHPQSQAGCNEFYFGVQSGVQSNGQIEVTVTS